jgi:hypothetical protein
MTLLNKVSKLIAKYPSNWDDIGLIAKIMDELLFAYRTSVVSSEKIVKGSLERGYVLEVLKSADNVDRLSKIIEGISPLSFDIHYFDEFDPSDEYMHPFLKMKMSKEDWKAIVQRARTETIIGGQMKLPQNLFVAICAAMMVGVSFDQIKANPFLRFLRFYLDSLPGEAFREGRGGTIMFGPDQVDSMASTRCYMCLRCFFLSIDGQYPLDVLTEVFLFLFNDPYARGSIIKKGLTMPKQSFFDLAEIGSGEVLYWDSISFKDPNPTLSGFKVGPVIGNDSLHFKLFEKKITEGIDILKENGLVKLAETISFLIKASPNQKNLGLASIMINPHYITGFMRTNAPISHKKTVEGEFPQVKDAPFGKYISQQMKEACEYYLKNPRYPKTEADILRLAPSTMTSRSAGIGPLRMEVSTGQRFPGSLLNDATGRWARQFSFTDKTMHFYRNPWAQLLKEHKVYSSEKIRFRVGSRHVPGKATRAIYLMPLPIYLLEVPVIPALADSQMRFYNSEISDPLHGSHIYTLGKETGLPLIDHATGLYASSREEVMIVEQDFTSFDISEKWDNVWKYIVAGIDEAIAENLMPKGGVFGYKSALHGLKEAYSSMKSLHFITGDIKLDGSWLTSGLLGTLPINNITNTAFARYFYSRFRAKGKARNVASLSRWLFQGDDSVSFWNYDKDQWNSEIYEEMANAMVLRAKENGLDLNFQKTVFRSWFYEYLKKHAIYGWFFGNKMSTDIFSAERPAYDQDPIVILRSLASTAATMAARGYRQDLMTASVMMMWNIKRMVLINRSHERKNAQWFVLPFCGLYAPTPIGVGLVPGSLIFASRNGLCALHAFQDTKLYNLLNGAMTTMNAKHIDPRRDIVRNLISGKYTTPKNYFGKGIDLINKYVKEPRKIKASKEATARLAKLGVKAPRLSYEFFTRNMFEMVLSGNASISKLDADVKSIMGRAFAERLDGKTEDVLDEMYGWMSGLTVSFTDKKINASAERCPLASFGPKYSELVRILGFRKGKNVFEMHPERILSFLKRDPTIPRYLRSEMILAAISKPNIINFPERIVDTLIILGVDQQIAAQAVASLKSQGLLFAMMTEATLMSTADLVIGQCDLSRGSYEKLVDTWQVNDPVLESVIQLLGLGYALTSYMQTGVIKQVRITFTDEALGKMLTQFTGRRNRYKALKYLGVYYDLTKRDPVQ